MYVELSRNIKLQTVIWMYIVYLLEHMKVQSPIFLSQFIEQ